MKKLGLMLMLCCAVSAFAKVTTWSEAWNTTNATDITEWFTAKGYPFIADILKALIGKDATNITYDEYKKIIFNAIDNDSSLKHKEAYKYTNLCQFTFNVNRFNKFASDVIKDNSVTGLQDFINRSNFLSRWYKYFSKSDFRNRAKSGFNKDNLNACQNIINIYENNMNSFTDAEIKEDMKAFKRLVYPKIGTSDEWKQLAVKIELLLKSVE